MRKLSAVEASILENIGYEVGDKGELVNALLKGKIVVKSPKAAKRLQLVLSNAYRMTNIHIAPNVMDSNLPLGRSVVFDLQKGENTILNYEVDLHSTQMPLKTTITVRAQDEALISSFKLRNTVEQSNVMNNSIKDLQAFISISPEADPEAVHFEGDGHASFSKKNGISWSLEKIERKSVRKLTYRFVPTKKLKRTQMFGSMAISFELPNRTISGIFIEKIQTSSKILQREVPTNFIYRTLCKRLLVKFRHPFFLGHISDTSSETRLIVNKNAIKKNVETSENAEIVISVKNIGENATKNLRVSDEIPRGFYLIEGRNFWYGKIRPRETREISYIIKPKIPGEYVLRPAEVTYESSDGKRHVAKSSSLKISVRAKTQISSVRICSKCGAKIPQGAKFCGICGNPANSKAP